MSEAIVILTGAGISAESGLATFRASDGLWEEHRVEDIATPEGFARDPELVTAFYNERRAKAASAAPNAAHKALARLQDEHNGPVLLVTQNVDDLHERAGSAQVLHMHGSLSKALCGHCGHRWAAPRVMSAKEQCPRCHAAAGRPDIVWFGEMPYEMERIYKALEHADLFLSIGTSGNVYPAAGFVEIAASAGAKTIELNLEPSAHHIGFEERIIGPATQIVPAWVNAYLGPGLEPAER